MPILIGLLINIACVAICCFKAKYGMATVGLFVGPVAIVGACRLAKPESRWAGKFYAYGKARKSWERFERSPYPGQLPEYV